MKNCSWYFLIFTIFLILGNAILFLSSTILNDSCDSDKECAKHYEIELLRALICVEGLTVMFMWTKYIVAVRKFKKDNKKPDVYREDFRRKVLNKWVALFFSNQIYFIPQKLLHELFTPSPRLMPSGRRGQQFLLKKVKFITATSGFSTMIRIRWFCIAERYWDYILTLNHCAQVAVKNSDFFLTRNDDFYLKPKK